MSMSLAELVAFEALKRKVETLERELLALKNERPAESVPRRKRDPALGETIRQIRDAHCGPSEIPSKRVLQELARRGIEPMPSIRCIQWHLRRMRNCTVDLRAQQMNHGDI